MRKSICEISDHVNALTKVLDCQKVIVHGHMAPPVKSITLQSKLHLVFISWDQYGQLAAKKKQFIIKMALPAGKGGVEILVVIYYILSAKSEWFALQ